MSSHEDHTSGRVGHQDTGAGRVPRRHFLRYSGGVAAAGLAGAGLLTSNAAAVAGVATGTTSPATGLAAADGNLAARPARPPAAPLAVRGPYLSTWLPSATLPGTWQQFWSGHTTAMGGIVRIDGTSYQ